MYMAPEVLRCQPYNEKSDVFSFAIIMYEVRLALSNRRVMTWVDFLQEYFIVLCGV